MDLKKIWETAKGALKGKQLSRLVFPLGICGMVLIGLSALFQPSDSTPQPEPDSQPETLSAVEYQRQLEEDLRRVVKAVTGESAPEVMVTLEDGGRWVYARDRKTSRQESAGEEEISHVVLEDGEGAQHGLELSQEQPKVKGAVIVSGSAADPVMREKLVNAARTALGIPSSRVCVVEGG